MNDFQDDHSKSVGERYFVRFLKNEPASKYALIPTLKVPDSVQNAPSAGWTEQWMKEHYPKVVEYIHDPR